MTTNYRSKIEEIIARYERAGDCLGESILEGAPDVIDWDSALGVALWLRDYADNEWNPDPRHAQIASEIIELAGN